MHHWEETKRQAQMIAAAPEQSEQQTECLLQRCWGRDRSALGGFAAPPVASSRWCGRSMPAGTTAVRRWWSGQGHSHTQRWSCSHASSPVGRKVAMTVGVCCRRLARTGIGGNEPVRLRGQPRGATERSIVSWNNAVRAFSHLHNTCSTIAFW